MELCESDTPVQERQPVEENQEWNYVQIDARKKLPLRSVSWALHVVRVVSDASCQGLVVCAWIVLDILNVFV